jgi:AraC-like DNA-binding protein
MTEVEPGSFTLFMGDKLKVDHGLTHSEDGEVDDGYRCVLVVSIRALMTNGNAGDFQRLQIPRWAKERVTEKIHASRGRAKKWDGDDTLIGVFNEAEDAVRCAEKIQRELQSVNESPVSFKISITADQPVTRNGEFFSRAVRFGNRLCAIADNNQILVSALASKLTPSRKASDHVRFLDIPEEEFILALLDVTDNKLAEENFNVASICKDVGISRPQLYRKITSLTGRAPNDFLRDLRLEKSLTLLRQRTKNISQIAMEVGYSNPSYFAKCFAEKFGCMPSEVFAASGR